MRHKNEGSVNNLVVLLCVLVMIIIGLVVGVIVTRTSGSDSIVGSGEEEYVLPEELMADDLSPEDLVIKETSLMLQNPDISNTEIERYYDEVISEAIDNGETFFAVRIVIQKMDFLAVIEEDCNKAKEYVDGLDLSFYSEEEKGYLNSYIDSMMNWCEAIDSQELEGDIENE